MSGQRSSPLIVDPVPSVIESPNVTTVLAPGTTISTASRKNQDVVVKGKDASASSAPKAPLRGAER